MTPTLRLGIACVCFASWMGLLLWGYAGGGTVHLLLVAAVAIMPWKSESSGGPTDT